MYNIINNIFYFFIFYIFFLLFNYIYRSYIEHIYTFLSFNILLCFNSCSYYILLHVYLS